MIAETKTGIQNNAEGVITTARSARNGAAVTGDGQGRYYEQTARGNVFSLVLGAWTTGVAAGNLNAAAAAASTQFALWNPIGSGKNIALLKFAVQLVSGTTPAGGLYHSYSATQPTIATSVVTPIVCNNVGLASASVARALSSAAGANLTGSSALAFIRAADLQFSAGTYAALATNKAVEYIDGDIVIPPGTCWVPTWTAAGTSLLGGYSVTWEEIPV